MKALTTKMSFFGELKRRNVFRVGAAYVAVSWLVIQVVETVFPVFGLSNAATRNIIVLLMIGSIPVVVLSWTFQLTPDGLKRDRGTRELLPDPGATRILDRTIIVILVIGISYFAFDKFVLAPERAAEREAEVAEQAKAEAITGYYGDRSIAVLPFENMSADPEQQYFVDGVAEELLNLLARIRQLRVVSRSSSFALRDLDLEVREIAERLDVAHVLEGSVRKMGNTVRVTVQLIEARTDTHLWSQSYERDLDNVFAIQDEIAGDVVSNLKIKLLRALPASRMVDPDAVALTQQAKMIFETPKPGAGTRMTELLHRAIDIDANYVAAWEQQVWADWLLRDEGLISAEEEQQRYRATRRRVLELEPESSFVDATDASYAMIIGNYEEAASLFERSLSKDPNNSEAAQFAGSLARELGKFDEATRLGEHAVAVDPLCYSCLWNLSRTHLYAGNYGAAVQVRERFILLGGGGKHHYGLMLLLQGKPDEALKTFETLDSDQPRRYAGLAMAYHDLGEHSRAEDELARLMRSTGNEEIAVLVAETAAWMGERDVAFEWLQQAADNPNVWLLRPMNPAFRNLRDDPRWDEYLESIGMSSARLDAIDFDPVLPE